MWGGFVQSLKCCNLSYLCLWDIYNSYLFVQMIFSSSYLKAADTFTDARMCQAFRKIFMLFCIKRVMINLSDMKMLHLVL